MSAKFRSGPAGTTSVGGAMTPESPFSTGRPAFCQAVMPPSRIETF